MVKDTGRRDSAGLEDMDAFFSPAVEKSPKKGELSSAGRLRYRTKFQAAVQSDDSVPMSGTSSNSSVGFSFNDRLNTGTRRGSGFKEISPYSTYLHPGIILI
jgi:hypothetical protein